MSEEQERANELELLDYDLYVNMLNPPSFEDLGKAVYQKLKEAKSGSKYFARHVVVCGS